jgi:hypothetical protein
MKMFDSPIEAVREIKEQSQDMGIHEDFYLCYNEMSEKYYVTDVGYDLGEQIGKSFDGGDSAESHARMFQVWKYVRAEKKEKYPNTYRHAKKSVIEGLIRTKVEVEPEYSVSFNIS